MAAAVDIKDGKPPTDRDGALGRWTESCSEVYNDGLHPDSSTLKADQTSSESGDSPPVMKQEAEVGEQSLKEDRWPGVDDISYEMSGSGGEKTVKNFVALCLQMQKPKEMPTEQTWTSETPSPHAPSHLQNRHPHHRHPYHQR